MTTAAPVLPVSAEQPTTTEGWRLGRRPGLDGIRAVAVAVVVLDHTGWWGFQGGGFGVDVFFTLSGFLITSLLLEELADTGRLRVLRFWGRRMLRLYPALLVLVLFVVAARSWLPPKAVDATMNGVQPTLLYYTNWVRAYGPDVGVFGHTWSLGVEEQFYLLWPGLLYLLWRMDRSLRRPALLLLVLVLLVVTLRELAWAQPVRYSDRIYNGSGYRSDCLMIGCALSMAMHGGFSPAWLRHRLALPLGGLSLVVIFLSVEGMESPWWFRTAVGLCTAVVIAAVCAQARGVGFLSAAGMRWLGVRSYSLYLWHFPIMGMMRIDDRGLTPAWKILVALLLSVAAAAASYRFVERPFLRLKDRLRVVDADESRPPARASGH